MNHNRSLARTLTGIVVSGGIALTGLGLATPTAHASPVGSLPILAFHPKPEPPVQPASACCPGLESPRVRVGFDPQPEPPLGETTTVSP